MNTNTRRIYFLIGGAAKMQNINELEKKSVVAALAARPPSCAKARGEGEEPHRSCVVVSSRRCARMLRHAS